MLKYYLEICYFLGNACNSEQIPYLFYINDIDKVLLKVNPLKIITCQ